MATPIISVRNLVKAYRLYASPQDRLKEAVFPWRKRHSLFHALNDLSFDVYPGEHLGILGVNGAGKSTLLQILSGVLTPTSGTVEVHGRISALLELGAGFNQELSGRENARFQLELAGFDSATIESKLTEVERFAELGVFFDQPVKLYSSGMFARAAFSCAILAEPDILIVDEALSVGDARFQRKCFAKMEEFRRQNKTILFVTHAENIVSEFCSRGILMGGGKILLDSDTGKVIQAYNELMYGGATEQVQDANRLCLDKIEAVDDLSMELPTHATRYGVRQTAEIVRVSMLDENGNEVIEAQTGQKYRLQAIIKIMQDMDDCGYLFTIRNITGVMIFGTHTANCGVMLPPVKKGDVIVAGLDIDMNIVNGDYFVTAGVAKFGLEVVNQDVWQDALMIKIPYTDAIFHAACVHLNHEFEYSVVSGKAE